MSIFRSIFRTSGEAVGTVSVGGGANYKSELDSTTATENEVVILTEDISSQQSYTKKLLEIRGGDTDKVVSASLTRAAETSATEDDFADGEVGIYGGTLTFSASATAARAFTSLESEDEIWIDATESSASFVLIINDSTTIEASTRNSVATVDVSGYTATTTITLTDEADYLIRPVNVSMNNDAVELLHDGNLHISADATLDSAFFDLTADDEIHILPENGNPFILDLSDSPALGAYAGADTIMVLARDFTSTPALDIIKDTEYTIYAVKNRYEVNGSAFEFDGNLWKRVYENIVDSDNIVNSSVALRDIETLTPGNVLGFDLSGNPTDAGATHVITLISTASGTNKLSYNALKDTPTIPVDTTLWKGTYATGTAYAAGDIVVHSNNLFLFTQAVTTANTEADPADITGAEQIDIGGSADITGISYDHPIITLTQRDNTQTTVQIGILRAGDATPPASHVKGDLYLLEGAKSSVDAYTIKLSRTATTSTDASDFATGLIQLSTNGNLTFALDGTDADEWTDLGRNERIVFVPTDSGNATVTFTINSNSPREVTRNSVPGIRLNASDSTRVGTFVDDATYTVYPVYKSPAVHGELFESDGNFWKCVYSNVIGTGNIDDNAVTRAKLQKGPAGQVLGYDADGNPAALSGAPIATLLESLSGTQRLNFDSLRNKPTIPVDTTLWKGTYATSTAYAAGDIVVHSGNLFLFTQSVANTNTATTPATITGVEQIDVGGAGDVTGVTWNASTKTLTVTVRSGTATNHTLSYIDFKVSSTFPTSHGAGDQFLLNTAGNRESYIFKGTRTGETSVQASNFDTGEIGIYSGLFVMSASTSEQTTLTSLGSGDRIVLVPSTGNRVILTLSASPTTSTHNSLPVVRLGASSYSVTGSIADATDYTVYALKTRGERAGSLFTSDGNFYERSYALSIGTADIVNNSVTLDKLAHASAGNEGGVLGYDASGEPTETTRRNLGFGSTRFPTSPHIGDIFIFTADTTINWKDINGSTDLTDAVKSDVARWNGTNWVKQMTLSDAVSSSGTDFHIGTSYPSSHGAGDHFLLESTGSIETYRFKGTRTGETNPAGTQFDAGEVGIFTGTFTMSVSQAEQTTLTTFGSGDRLVLVPASGTNVVVTLTGGFNAGELNSHRILRLFASNFSVTGAISDNTIYTVYGLRSSSERAGSIFESDGNFFQREYQLSVDTAHIVDNSVTLAKMAHVPAGEEESIIGYNASGEPTLSRRRAVDLGTGFPTDPAPKEGDVFIFTSDVDSGLTWISEAGAALTDAKKGDVAYYSASTWARRINFDSGGGSSASGDAWTFGTAYPASPADEDLFKLSQDATLETYLTVVPRDAETSATVGDFNSDEVGIYSGVFVMQASTAVQAVFTSLDSGDEIVLVPTTGDTVTLSLTGSPVTGTRNTLTTISVSASNFTLENALVDGTRYQVYAVKSRGEVKGSIFEFDGNYWARIYNNTIGDANIPAATISPNKIKSGNEGNVVGFQGGVTTQIAKTNLLTSHAFPSTSDPLAKLYLTTDTPASSIIIYKSSATGETSATAGDFASGEVGVFSNDLYWAVGADAQDTLIEQDMVVGDIILFSPSTGGDVTVTISALASGGTPLAKATRNSLASITIDEDNFTQSGTFVNGRSYNVYFIKNTGTEIQGSLYERTGGYWERVHRPDPPTFQILPEFPDDKETRDADTLLLTQIDQANIIEYGPITRTAETSATEDDFAAGAVGVYSNDLVIAVSEREQADITELELKTYSNQATAVDALRDDVILFKSDAGDVLITIIANDWGAGSAGSDPYDDDSPVVAGTRNSIRTVTIDSAKFNQSGTFVDEREYEVYFIKKNRDEKKDTYFEAKAVDDAIYWERLFDPTQQSDSSTGGVSSVSPNLRQLTQWKRASSTPDAPGNTTLDSEGFYTNFPDTANSWSASIPSGADALYVATATITRNTAGEWGYNTAWTVNPESSSQIQFWHVGNQAWEASATSGRNSQMRIWTAGGWKIIPLEGEFKLLEKWMSPASVSSVSNVRLSDIDKMRFEIVHYHSQFQVSVSRSMLFGEDDSNIGSGTPTSANQATVDNNTVYLYWDYRGAMRIWKKTPTDDVDITNTSVEGMIRINFYKNSEDELTHISTFSPLGRADNGLGYGALLRIYLEV